MKNKKVLIAAVVILLALTVGVVITVFALLSNSVSAEVRKAKESFLPPAEAVSLDLSQDDPSNDEISFSYDGRYRIISCTYSVKDKEYKQNYSYNDTENKVTIETVYKTYIIEEKIINYSQVTQADIFVVIDGYIVRLDETAFESEKVIPTQEAATMPLDTAAKETIIKEPATQVKDYQNLVDTAKKATVSFYSGDTVVFRIPKVMLDSEDAKSVNAEILQRYQKYFAGSDHGCVQLDYVYYTYDNMLSIVIGSQFEGGGDVGYSIYTFDVKNANLLHNDDLRNRFSVSETQVIEKIRTAEDNHFGDMFDYTWDESIITIYDDAYDHTIDNDNLKDYQLFVGTKGLMAEINEYTMAGAGASRVTIDLENNRVFRYFSQLQEEY